ncbi:MAG: hypothetical protein KDA96_06710, partial [Planctomycetaceae bacterium]|nr:hypothetical protein [Planctomycetaceae bacterium]
MAGQSDNQIAGRARCNASGLLVMTAVSVFGLALHAQAADKAQAAVPARVTDVLRAGCLDCHQGASAEAGFDLEL